MAKENLANTNIETHIKYLVKDISKLSRSKKRKDFSDHLMKRKLRIICDKYIFYIYMHTPIYMYTHAYFCDVRHMKININ